ncbi:MAG: SAM-dependent methyltransferase [Halioglobus sp.]|jgi:SAM-dependent methyltransferase
MAQTNSGCPVIQQQFLSLNLPDQAFDGAFANASLLYIPGQELPRVLRELHSSLRPKGILLTSNPRGNNEGWSSQRYGHFIEYEESLGNLEAAGFKVLERDYRPVGVPRSEQPWLAIVSRRVG